MQKEKVRVYALARELNMESKDLLDLCRQAGMDVKNQLSSLDPEQRDLVEQLVKKGSGSGPATATVPTSRPVGPPPVLPAKVRVLDARGPRREAEQPARPTTTPTPEPVAEQPPTPSVTPATPVTLPTPAPSVAPPTPATPPPAAARTSEPEQRPPIAPPAMPAQPAAAPPTPPVPPQTAPPPAAAATAQPASRPATPQAPPVGGKVPDLSGRPPTLTGGKVPDLSQPRPGGDAGRRRREGPRFVRMAPPPALKKAPPKEEKKAQEPIAQKPILRPPAEVLRSGAATPQEILARGLLGETTVPPVDVEDEEGEGAKGKARPGQVTGRDKRHAQRSERAKQRKGRVEAADVRGTRVLLPAEEDRPQRMKSKLKQLRHKQTGAPTQPRKGKVPIDSPITVRSLSEAVGVRTRDLLLRLMNLGVTANINTTLDPDVAETIALECGCELDIKKPQSAEDDLLARLGVEDRPEDLLPRAPIVAVMGHVDHGKTSLLDRIRQSNIAATEAGGITQVIRAWRVEHLGKWITFLDTPGHEAFTKMRARGANVTDIAVIVVAADDGVMPQTEEAVSHAKAAGVPIVVALNKVDLPNANVNRTRQQLYGLGLLPDNMGGDVPFVETSAASGQGIDLLLENLSLLAELKELKGNPNKPAQGTCLEAALSEGEGVRATLLVQDGTLHRGDVIICGAAYGRVRALYDDLGRPIDEAGPSTPVRITGLDEVPDADDPFAVAEDLTVVREIAARRKSRRQEAGLVKREPVKLEKLSEAKIAELKVILKADFRGSVEAIRKELEKLQHEEVRVRLLHAAIGGITESDVQLALTSPDDTLIVGFNVVPDERARSLAEERGIQIRQYNIIYNLTDDIKQALQGKLKPREEVIFLGRANVREVFKISRVGTVAGCYVTQGVIERSAKVRVIREGVVVYPPPDRTASLDSLKRFKEDAREVREGFECGLKIAGYDDIKVGDSIEAYRVEQIQRTL